MKKEAYIFFCSNVRDKNTGRPSCGGEKTEYLYEYCRQKIKENRHLLRDGCYVKANKTGCLGKCDKGPNLVIFPENRWCKYDSKEDIDRILEEYTDGFLK